MIEKEKCIIVDNILVQFLGGKKEIVVPDGVVKIGAGAFHGYNVESVYLPDGVVEIGNNCFNNCKKLKTIRIPASVQKISETAFRDTSQVQIVTPKGTYAWKYVQNICNSAKNGTIENINITLAEDTNTKSKPAAFVNSKPQPTVAKPNVTELPKKPTSSKAETISPPSVAVNKCSSMQNNISRPLGKPLQKNTAEQIKKAEHTKSNTTISVNSKSQPTAAKPNVTASPKKPTHFDVGVAPVTYTAVNKTSPAQDNIISRHLNELFQTGQDKEREYARILGCDVGDRPWTMKNNFLGRAERFAERVQQITNQGLLIKIASEAKMDCIKCAAIRNITSQEVLTKYAGHSSANVRLAATRNLQDQTTLINLATTDSDTSVRDAAIKKVKDRKIIKQYLLTINKDVKSLDFNGISEIKDLQELAIYAKHFSVRKHAADLLPPNAEETKLLKAAAELSNEIEPYAIERFKEAANQLQQKNHSFIDVVASRYPVPGIRYLARKKASIKPKVTGNMEELLGSKTPSHLEITQQKEIQKCEELLIYAKNDANNFLKGCHRAAEKGKKEYTMTTRIYDESMDYKDEEMFRKLLLDILREKGFTNVSIKSEAESQFYKYEFEVHTYW